MQENLEKREEGRSTPWSEARSQTEQKMLSGLEKNMEISKVTSDLLGGALNENIEKLSKDFITDTWWKDQDNKNKLIKEGVYDINSQDEKYITRVGLEKGALEDLGKNKEYKAKNENIEQLYALQACIKGEKKFSIDEQVIMLHVLREKSKEIDQSNLNQTEKDKKLKPLLAAQKELAEKITGNDFNKELEKEGFYKTKEDEKEMAKNDHTEEEKKINKLGNREFLNEYFLSDPPKPGEAIEIRKTGIWGIRKTIIERTWTEGTPPDDVITKTEPFEKRAFKNEKELVKYISEKKKTKISEKKIEYCGTDGKGGKIGEINEAIRLGEEQRAKEKIEKLMENKERIIGEKFKELKEKRLADFIEKEGVSKKTAEKLEKIDGGKGDIKKLIEGVVSEDFDENLDDDEIKKMINLLNEVGFSISDPKRFNEMAKKREDEYKSVYNNKKGLVQLFFEFILNIDAEKRNKPIRKSNPSPAKRLKNKKP
jgi:hypothetical protein